MDWKKLFTVNDDYLELITPGLEPESRKEALEFSMAKWEAMVALGPSGDGGYSTCGMCALYGCGTRACFAECGVNCFNDSSLYAAWNNDGCPENAQAVLDQLRGMYEDELENLDTYYIVGKCENISEILDETDNLETAGYLRSEYQLAFGQEWSVWVSETRDVHQWE